MQARIRGFITRGANLLQHTYILYTHSQHVEIIDPGSLALLFSIDIVI